jgi:hypothetical protein
MCCFDQLRGMAHVPLLLIASHNIGVLRFVANPPSDGQYPNKVVLLGKLCQLLDKETAFFDHNLRNLLKLEYLLPETRGFQVTDARDKIFALLNIASDESLIELQETYSKAIREIYTSAARRLITLNSDLAFFAYRTLTTKGAADFPHGFQVGIPP